ISTPVTCRISVGVSSSRDSMLPISLRKRRPISAAVVGGAKAWGVDASVVASVPSLRGALECTQPATAMAVDSSTTVAARGKRRRYGSVIVEAFRREGGARTRYLAGVRLETAQDVPAIRWPCHPTQRQFNVPMAFTHTRPACPATTFCGMTEITKSDL